MTKVFNMSAAIQLSECRDEASSGKFPSQVLAANSDSGGGGMDDILRRLGTVESAVVEVREQVIGIAATIPSLATKTDIGDVRLEVSELIADVRGIAAIIPHLATKAELSAEIGSMRADLSEIGKQVGSIAAVIPHLATKADVKAGETSIIKWLVPTAIAIAGLAFSIAKFVH
jgi:hypothetical protein